MDQYKNPFEKNYTVSEVLEWFQNNNIQYISSIPIDFNVDEPLFKKKILNNKKILLFWKIVPTHLERPIKKDM